MFLERDVPWYAANRDLPNPPYGHTELYPDLATVKERFTAQVRDADVVIVGSYVPEGVAVGEWVTRTTRGIAAFYDIDTPVTLAKLERGDTEYLARHLISRYHLYLSFTGGPILDRLEKRYGAQIARTLCCSFDPMVYYAQMARPTWDLGFMGTYAADRQPALENLMLAPARQWQEGRMALAGSLFPAEIEWPANVERMEHLPPSKHRAFYTSQRFTLNITRADMVRAGYSPSVRLFEASACATTIISDYWEGLDTFFRPGSEILVARSGKDVLAYLHDMSDEERSRIGENARRRVMAEHTAAHRAAQLESYLFEVEVGQRIPLPPFELKPIEQRSAMRAP